MRAAPPNLPLVAPALGAVFGLATLLVLLAVAPLSLVLGDRAAAAGLSAAEVSGTVWRGRLSDAAYRGLRLGDVGLGVRPLSLLAGCPRLGFKGEAATGLARERKRTRPKSSHVVSTYVALCLKKKITDLVGPVTLV